MMYFQDFRNITWSSKTKLKIMEHKIALVIAFLSVLYTRALGNSPPRFLIEDQSEIVLRFKEGPATPIGTILCQLKGYDSDGDILTFGIQNHNGNSILQIENLESNQANVYLKKELDRETKDEYSFVLTLTDGHLGEGNFITQSLLLLVEDVNDNEPIFKPYNSTINFPENSGPGIVAVVEATDQDEGAYGQVIYNLEVHDDDEQMFSISTINGQGVIQLIGQLDYERKFLYQLHVLAVDRAINEKMNTGTAAILLKVEDVEDQPPEFVVVSPVTRISEDAHIGTSVLQVKAVDGDRGINNRIRYSITSGAQGCFEINSFTGVVFTIKKLDRESPENNNGAYILEIMAKEDSRTVMPPPIAKTEVTVIVTDVNDEVPTFRSQIYLAEVNENAQINTPITFLESAIPEVFDHDQGKNGTFVMYTEGDNGSFEVSPSQGINEASFLIRVKNPSILDFEKRKFLNFTLFAKETVTKYPKYTAVPVAVYINDINDNFPEFLQQYYEVDVLENVVVGTTVVRIQALDKDSGRFGSEGIRYTNITGSISNLLHLNPITGEITVKLNGSGFDREMVSRHYLNVEAQDDVGFGNRNTVQLVINILDVNDNAPIFLQNKYEVRLKENSKEFESPLYVEAVDLDLNGTENSQIHYSIMGGNPYNNFTIDAVHGLLSPITGIDFEELISNSRDPAAKSMNVHPIVLKVHANDLGEPSLSSETTVVIHVQDVNDHAPHFEQQVYNKSIPEDLLGGTNILQVKAWDADGSAPNNEVVYRIQSGAEDKFVIDADTGIISVARGANLDPDRTDPKTVYYALYILALDGGIGSEQHTATAMVNVNILDVNNKPPQLIDPGIIHVKENLQVGQFVHHIVATDLDENPVLRYYIDPDSSEARNEEGTIVKSSEYNYVEHFELSPVDGKLKIIKLLDREIVEIIRLGIVVEDLAASSYNQITTGVLTVIIDDENDNNPKFWRPYYYRSIMENSKNGISIVNVVAEDADKNRTISYSVEGSKVITDLVHLDSETGEIVVGSKIDHELHPWLNFTVRATDSGVPPRSSLVEVFIQVLDENDNNPYFLSEIHNITIREDAPIGTAVATIEAQDADSGEFGKITYLLDRISSKGKFQINPHTGVINVSNHLNREEQSYYMLIIEAWDNYQFGYVSGESRNAFKQIGVNIVDVNDEPPEFEPVYGCVTITEFHEVNEVIYIVKANDADDPNTPNGKISFSIIAGNELGLFRIENIDYTSAQILTARQLKAHHGNYTLMIEARDQGVPSNAVTMELMVCVTDFNDNAPQFISPHHNTTVRVPENATIGAEIIQVQAIDNDIGVNGAVRYRFKQDIMGNWQMFSINETTGCIRLKRQFDRKKQKLYEVRVEAYDLGVPTPLSSDLDLTIYVKSMNGYEPQYLVDEYILNFTEHAEPGTQRWKIIDTIDKDEVDDLDDPPTAVCYFIVNGNQQGYFEIEPLAHEISFIKELDRETLDTHILVIKATEDCKNPPTDKIEFDPEDDTLLKLIIRVEDINDNEPHFIKHVFTGGVTSETDFGTEFMQVKAIDIDAGKNAEVKYYQIGQIQRTLTEGLENIREPPFTVDHDTGAIRINFDPQRRMKGYFDFMVLANDSDGLQDMAHVFIYLLREDQQVRFVLRQQPPEVREKIEIFRDILGNVTGAIVNVDDFKVHENQDGSVDKTRTDVYLHFVDHNDHSVMDVNKVLNLIDQNIEKLDKLFKDFNVLDTQPAQALILKEDAENLLILWLAGSTVFLGLLLILVISICLSQRAHFQRQLKAATVTAFGLNDSDLNQATGHLPNTNMHSVEGSNPIWMQAYENEWYKEDESLSQTSETDSLDENAVENEAMTVPTQMNPTSEQSPGYTDVCKSELNVCAKDIVNKQQNDLNQTAAHCHQNIYQHLHKIANPLLSKKLETTEL